MGPLRVPDEPGHMFRAYLVSEGFCAGQPAIGNPAMQNPAAFRSFKSFPWIRLPSSSTGRDLLALVDDSHQRPLHLISRLFAVNLYSCVPYLPAGAAIRIGRFFTTSPALLMYIGRFANLLFYLVLVLLSMQLLPEFQFLLALLALMPMSLHQAASLSADSVTIAVSFLITVYILKLALAGPAPLRRTDYLLLIACAILAGLCKSTAGLMLLLPLIPAARFANRRTRWFATSVYIALAFAVAALWQYVNSSNREIHATLKAAADIHLEENTALILHHPTVFISAVLRTFAVLWHEYLDEFVGKLGWLDVPLPRWITWVYLALLVIAAAAQRIALQIWQRLLLIGVFLFNLAALYAVIWTTEMTRPALSDPQAIVSGLQGRYFIPLALLPLLAISPFAIQLRRRSLVISALVTATALNAVALGRVWDRYQARSSTFPNRLRLALHLDFSPTAAQLYENRVIRTSGATPFLVSGGSRHLAPSKLSITSRGFDWAEDLVEVSPQEIESIPLGAPLEAPPDYEGQLVRRPGSNPDDAKVYFVHEGQKHWIVDGKWIIAHGFKWPDDIHTIPAASLASIPDGAPLP